MSSTFHSRVDVIPTIILTVSQAEEVGGNDISAKCSGSSTNLHAVSLDSSCIRNSIINLDLSGMGYVLIPSVMIILHIVTEQTREC